MCVHYFPNVHCFDLMSVRNCVCRSLGYCDLTHTKIMEEGEGFVESINLYTDYLAQAPKTSED